MDQKQIDILTQKIADKTISDAELKQYYDWLASDDQLPLQISGAENREELQNRIFSNIAEKAGFTSARTKTVKLWPRIVAAAAIAVVIFGAGLWYFGDKRIDTEQQILAEKIIPGGNKAILTLANGEKISLTDAVNGQLALQSGMKITKTADGQLVYEVAKDGSSAIGIPQYNTIEVPVGGQWQAVLSDGSRVWLNALSSITFPTSFTGKERKVEIKGEAYLEIAHNKAKPFKVSSLGQTIEVLGTHFNVMAYPDEKVIKTTLLEGSVKISKENRSALLKPGEQAQATNGNIKVTDEVDIEDVVAWKNGYFKFDENLESIMSKVGRWYDVEVVYNYKPDANLQFAGKVSRSKNISALLKIIEFNGDVHFKIEGRRVVVMR
ncbi:MAG: FecR domain-containing protein [Pedobacter sp.]|jgi:ferric-dicitrate binding protein FerR (iron transport regulator)|uniref:FecR family protein n=1 Tax=Pedobacter sp. TaxID=1411316 RepID=UPI003568C75F